MPLGTKTVRFRHIITIITLIGNPMLDVQPTGQRGPYMITEVVETALTLKELRPQFSMPLYYQTRIANQTLPIIYNNYRYPLWTGKDRTRLFIFSAHLSTVYSYRRGRYIVDRVADRRHIFTCRMPETSVYSVYLCIYSFTSTWAAIDFQRGRRGCRAIWWRLMRSECCRPT